MQPLDQWITRRRRPFTAPLDRAPLSAKILLLPWAAIASAQGFFFYFLYFFYFPINKLIKKIEQEK